MYVTRIFVSQFEKHGDRYMQLPPKEQSILPGGGRKELSEKATGVSEPVHIFLLEKEEKEFRSMKGTIENYERQVTLTHQENLKCKAERKH